ncbi:MAG: amino acid adenylation domain-containing protein [Symploca sp. SIO2D2]|nr:amino acid adenylation domain-containing protein [Symploca sp. SIO2D2]
MNDFSPPEQPPQSIPILTDTELNKILLEFNDTVKPYPLHKTIVDLFEEQAKKTPDHIALVFEHESLTYQALNERANQVAHYLQTVGVKPEMLVGICMERSLEMIIGVLGILKAGGAYLPLDPHYPKARLVFMLEDTQVSLLLTCKQLLEILPTHQAQILCWDVDQDKLNRASRENPIPKVKPENLAYVIYTSGSTGQPKGILIAHKGLSNLALAQRDLLDVSPDSRFLQFASLSFDAAISDITTTLCSGATLCLATDESRLSSTVLMQQLQTLKITHAILPPTVLSLLPTTEELPYLQTIMVVGETCPPRLVANWSVGRRFFNGYGPSECTVGAIIGQCQMGQSKPLIGRPIANTQVYILDTGLQPVPIGIPGEIHLGGVGLARGYLHRPERTEEKFIANPFSDDPNARLYKTGDLGCYLPDGNIDYLGRLDQQVKIRSMRIELDEIETVLSQQPDVKECVVLVKEDETRDKSLVAYVVLKQPQLNFNELRQFLRNRLPDYMVPAAFVPLEAIPLTPNCKTDRRALLQLPVDYSQSSPNTFVAPRTLEEKILASIWSEILKIEKIGIDDHFFDLGGHSLLATQIISRIQENFLFTVPIREFFKQPTIAGLGNYLTTKNDFTTKLPSIQTIPRQQPLSLSFAQQRLWFLEQLEDCNAIYNIPLVLQLQGYLDIAALKQGLDEISQRHESLRTTFLEIDGIPSQIIHIQNINIFNQIDLSNLSKDEQTTETQRLINGETQRPFELEQGPLLRTTLLKLTDASHVLIVMMHHIISDGWSIGIFINELSTLYTALASGNPSPLPTLPIQYADFSHWQRQWLKEKVLEEQMEYWQQQLADIPTLLTLPTDRPRPPMQTFRGKRESFQLSKALTQKLKQLARQTETTLFMLLFGVFTTLLYRYSDQTDIVVGSPIAHRNHREIEPLIGFFVNTLVLRINFSNYPGFQELLKQIKRVSLDAYAHQDIPFEQLVEALQPERHLSYNPLFQVMFVLQNAPVEEFDLPGLQVNLLETEQVVSQFDLTLLITEKGQGLTGEFEYNCDLFEATTIKRMVGHFQTLLAGIIDNPQQKVTELPLLTSTEQQQLLIEWNRTTVSYPQEYCVHQLLEAQVEKNPNAIALVDNDEVLTYGELNRYANQLAQYLQHRGIKSDQLVGVCLERSFDLVIGLLAVLKAGAAYVPLDANYPQQRLTFMLEDSQVPVLLTQEKLLEKFSGLNSHVVCLDRDWGMIAQAKSENPTSDVQTSNLAYVIYTSGSTGQPKGVLIPHRGLLNLVYWHQQAFDVCETDHATYLAGTGFDASVWELWPYLTAGAQLHLVNSELLHSPIQLRDWLLAKQISISFLPTPIVSEMFALEWPPNSALRMILTGGDKLHQYPPTTLPFKVVNNYGPTENSVVTTSGVVTSSDNFQGSPPIGRPIANTQVYLLNSHLQPVPIGIPGELHIAGVGLALGYLGRPELTTAKFIANPFSHTPESRLYKTGDIARYLPDGNIEFVARIDNQVKIRGFRVELGEIESLLTRHSLIKESVVLIYEDPHVGKRLVAYWIPLPDATVDSSQLQAFLEEKLPSYMIPSAFVKLDAIPLTANGKVDFQALTQLSINKELFSQKQYVAPRTFEEKQLAEIWEAVLGVEQVGIFDDFFELGGHSLLATQVISRISDIFSCDLPLRSLFESPTVAGLSHQINNTLSTEWEDFTL